MTPTQLSELQTAVTEAIRTCNDAISKLCQVDSILKDIRFKPLLESIQVGEKPTPTTQPTFTPAKKKTGNPLEELLHNVTKLTPEQSWQIMQKINPAAKTSQSDTSTETVTPTKEST